MKLFKYILILSLTLTSLSCSDFKDSKPKVSSTGTVTNLAKPKPNPFDGKEADPNTAPFTEEKMLVNIGLNIIYPQTKRFRLQSEFLEMRVRDYCEALTTGQEIDEQLKSAQDQWVETMLDYNRLEAVPLGPLGDKELGLASNLYAYPYSATCPLDIQIASSTPETLSALPFSVKGLSALEYLLFDKAKEDENGLKTLGSSCFRPNPSVRTWMAKSEIQKQKDRCAWAQALSENLTDNAKLLEDYWDPALGNYTKSLIDGSKFTSIRRATNSLTDAFFSIEKIKDQRVGRPLGLHKDCPAEEGSCPDQVEHRYSGISFRAQAETLRFFEKAFLGEAPGTLNYGLDDLLEQNDANLTSHVKNGVKKVLETNLALREKGPFYEQAKALDSASCKATTATHRLVEICAYQFDLRALTQILKIEILTAFSPPLDAPAGLEGDGD